MRLANRGLLVAVIAVMALTVVVGLVAAHGSGAAQSHTANRFAAVVTPGEATLTIDSATTGPRVRPGFLGLSMEYWALENYAGQNPRAINPALVQLIKNLAPHQTAVLRIGGVTTDRTWWPVARVPRPVGAFYTLTKRRLQVAKALADAVAARLILGVQFEADSLVEASAESHAMIDVIGRKRVQALELGNEPELYSGAAWYKVGGVSYFGRPLGWNPPTFQSDFTRVRAAIRGFPVAGPTVGAFSWMRYLDQFLSGEPGLALVSLHRYPLQACSVGPSAPNYPTLAHLLGSPASTGLADDFAPYIAIVHQHGLQVRNGEMNTVSCGGASGVADTFASALWAVDALFEMARVGTDGVNVHTYPDVADSLFSVTRVKSGWRVAVKPEYYGLLMFAQAAPAGSRLLGVSAAGTPSTLKTWATRAPDGRIRVVLINKDTSQPQSVVVRIPGRSGVASLQRLEAPSALAKGGITLGGQTFGARTATGLLAGPTHPIRIAPTTDAYTVRVPAASAAMLTLN